MGRKSLIFISIILALAMMLVLFIVVYASFGIDQFDQCRNDAGVGPCIWTNGNLNASTSTYYEGDGTPQRLHLDNFTPQTQVVKLTYMYLKGGKHAYDYLVSYNHSETYIDFTALCNPIIVTGGCVARQCKLLSHPNCTEYGQPGSRANPGLQWLDRWLQL